MGNAAGKVQNPPESQNLSCKQGKVSMFSIDSAIHHLQMYMGNVYILACYTTLVHYL